MKKDLKLYKSYPILIVEIDSLKLAVLETLLIKNHKSYDVNQP